MSEINEQMIEKIDLYLTGNLTPIESTQFESEIASNPELQNEVNFQSEIVNSIKESRRLELKSRLSNIEVSSKSKWFSNTAIGGIAATVIVSFSIFGYNEYTKHDNNPTIIAQEQEVASFDERNNAGITNTNTELNVYNKIIQSTSNTENNNEEDKSNLDLTDVNAPDFAINDTEEEAVTNNSLATIKDVEKVNILSSGAANVAVEFKGGRKLAYKFYDEKLFLFGKFNEAKPYEVIEIKTHFGKEFYLKFNNDFYTIVKGKIDKTPLTKIENNKLIKKLNDLE